MELLFKNRRARRANIGAMLRSASQQAFLKLEAALNAVFGEGLNPLYCLGALAYWMLWIVVGSGLYAYAFYRTGLQASYGSVQALTAQPLGGLARSVHRYASDAMALVMLVHLLRHFVFDRYRGFRAFSWLTGAGVLCLVYASGVNGYMLPWDRLAQFVVTATAEWFDAVPVFRGVLVRNFILPEAVSDRFFSLLSFAHIGIPLALLVILWIHTQRVPRARIFPPWPLALASAAALTALALLKPALSQAPADLARLPAELGLDWFYLAAYPLLYAWSAAKLWMLALAGTLVVVAAPWLPPRRRGAALRITAHPGNRTLNARDGECVLDAGLRHGLPLRFGCRSGGCGECKGVLLKGNVDPGPFQPAALSPKERSEGKVLFCCAVPLTDIEIEFEPGAAGREPVRLYAAHIEALERLAPEVMLVRLRLDGGERIRFDAGQFVNIVLENGERRSYSFSTAPRETDQVELHVRLIPGGRFTTRVFNDMKAGDVLSLEGPLGASPLSDSDKPLILVAGATGFAPVKSLLEHAFEAGFRRQLILYWGARRARDLYLAGLAERWQREHRNFSFIPVLSEPASEDEWQGRTGLVHEAILADHPDLSGYEIYACGSAKMVEAARPAFIARGLPEDACYSDAFAASGPR